MSLVLIAGFVCIGLAALLDTVAMARHKLAHLEKLERIGNIGRSASVLVASLLFCGWVVLRRYGDDQLFPHFVVLSLAAAVLLAWAAAREQRRWKREGAPHLMRMANLVGTVGLFLLEAGFVVWAFQNPAQFEDPVTFVASVCGGGFTALAALACLGFLLWKNAKDARPPQETMPT